jgi:hypothetical protein
MKYIAVLLLLFPLVSFAGGEIKEIDLTSCIEKSCMSNDPILEFTPESNVKIQAGFNIVHWNDGGGTKFYPLFQLYNLTEKPFQIIIGMQLLDKNMSVLIEAKQVKLLNATKNTKPSYETGLSINAEPITKEIIRNTKYLRILYSREDV